MAELTPSPRSEGLAGRTSLKVTGTAAASSASSAAFMISRWQGCPHRANGGGARPSGQSRGCSGACGCARDSCRRNADKPPHHGPARLSTAHYQDGAEPWTVQHKRARGTTRQDGFLRFPKPGVGCSLQPGGTTFCLLRAISDGASSCAYPQKLPKCRHSADETQEQALILSPGFRSSSHPLVHEVPAQPAQTRAQARTGRVSMRGGSPRGLGGFERRGQLLDAGRLGELELAEDGPLRSCDLGALAEAAGRSSEGADLDLLELAAQVRPGVAAGGLGDADEEQGQPAEQHVGADALFFAVVDGPQVDDLLHVPPAALDLVELLVAEGDVRGRELGVGRAQEI